MEEKREPDSIVQINTKLLEIYPSFKLDGKITRSCNCTTIYCGCSEYADELYGHMAKGSTLEIDTDSIHEFSKNFIYHTHIKKLIVTGSRWWNFNMKHLPDSIEVLDISKAGNLQDNCNLGMERMINLKNIIYFYDDVFNFNIFQDQPCEGCVYVMEKHECDPKSIYKKHNRYVPITDIASLECIVFDGGICYEKVVENWKDYVIEHPIFSDVKYRIYNIDVNLDRMPIITIKLNPQPKKNQ